MKMKTKIKTKTKIKEDNDYCITTGISLPTKLFNELEKQRGDISRSLFVRKILDAYLVSISKDKEEKTPWSGLS